MKKILVTGGAGFIGSGFILYWLKKYPQTQIYNLDKLTYAGNLENLKSIESNPNYHFVQGDICNSKLVNSLIKDKSIDTIIHFAAETHVDRSISNPAPFIKTNFEGTYILLEAALKNKIKRFHHISTDEVFGELELSSQIKFTEKTAYDPHSPYSASKAGSDHLVRAYWSTYNLPITISNCSNNFGPYQFPEKFIPLAITNILAGEKIPLYGDGLHVRDWLYVLDHCEALDLILHQGKLGETYLIGGLTKDISNLEIVKKILKIMNKSEDYIKYNKDRPGHDRRYAVDWSYLKKTLGWKPRHSFDQALTKTINWYIEEIKWWQRVKSGAYKEYYRQQYQK